jgi:hypothetical protein
VRRFCRERSNTTPAVSSEKLASEDSQLLTTDISSHFMHQTPRGAAKLAHAAEPDLRCCCQPAFCPHADESVDREKWYLREPGAAQRKLRIIARVRITREARLSAIAAGAFDSNDILYRNAAEVSMAADISEATTSTSMANFS